MKKIETQTLNLPPEALAAHPELKIQCRTPTADGRFIAAHGLFGDSGSINNMIGELREMLTQKEKREDEEFRRHLLGLWIAVERGLLKTETDELRGAVLNLLFGDDTARVNLSRNGEAQGGRC